MESTITASQADMLIVLLEKLVDKEEEREVPELMTIDEACERWDIHRTTLRRLIDTGQVKSFKVGTKIRIPRKENEDAIK